MRDLIPVQASFYIQNIPIRGKIILAPMDGYTDSPFRSICRQFGSAASVSEFINGIDVVHGHPHLKFKTAFSHDERPFAYQLFDNDVERLLLAAQKLVEKQPDYMDINMGCSARNVSNRGAGSGLLKNPKKVGEIISTLTKKINLPITAKIRLGWDNNSKNYLEIAKIIQNCGGCAIAVHARTRQQEFNGVSDWTAITEIKKVVSIPVIGNGDLLSRDQALKMIELTGCDAVMIGRAALGNPWVFSGISKSDVLPIQKYQVMERHLSLMTELYGQKIGTLLFRKHLARYLHESLSSGPLKQKIFSIEEPDLLMKIISDVLNKKRSKNDK